MKGTCFRVWRVINREIFSRRFSRREIDPLKMSKKVNVAVSESLDLGSGPFPKNPFCASTLYGVDIRSHEVNPDVKQCRLGFEAIPFESNKVICATPIGNF